MLVIPYQTRFTLGSLPLATLVLIVLNVFVFFGLQGRDGALLESARDQYFASELPRIELPRYVAHLESRSDAQSRSTLRRLGSLARNPQPWPLVQTMQNDREFQKLLAAGAIVKPEEPGYRAWREQRDRFNALMAQGFTQRWALTGWDEPARLFTYSFLHGDGLHLLTNMLVLLLAGPFAEAALGRLRFLAGYLFAGVAAGVAHLAVSSMPLVGASGAVSGAMAMVAVLYGARRVPVFWTIGVYFDTARVPALALLPVWIAIEVLAWAAQPDSPVAYWAHLGGFAAGAAFAWYFRPRDEQRIDQIVEEHEAEDRQAARRARLIDEAQQAAARMDTRRALRAYGELAAAEPENLAFAVARFNIALLARDRAVYVEAANGVLDIRTRGARTQLRPVYLQMTQPKLLPLLSVEEQLRLARRLVAAREDAAALRVLDELLASEELRQRHARALADCLLGLYTTYARHGLRHQAESVRERLARYFPQPIPAAAAPATVRPSPRRGDTAARAEDGERTLPLEWDMATQFNTRPYEER
ncbi:MAG TPA: rhomboid family intramembrane serine protease [Burkholderiaceae bacterium]|nr:rhomboid family intramembrane serine protease [Burkholderiaceae bacterium]HPE01203.1 rhomboid family intramembrane serine protease [Burkholderiaceae bacterium]